LKMNKHKQSEWLKKTMLHSVRSINGRLCWHEDRFMSNGRI
jgi:hypothetical protein